MTADTASAVRWRALSPFSVVLAVGYVISAIWWPSLDDSARSLAASQGAEVPWAASGGVAALNWVFAVGVLAKDFWLATERARVWVNLGFLLFGGTIIAWLGSSMIPGVPNAQ